MSLISSSIHTPSYSAMITPMNSLNQVGSIHTETISKEDKSNKEKYVNGLVSYPSESDYKRLNFGGAFEFEDRLNLLPLEKLKNLYTHLSPFFNQGFFANEDREDIVKNLLGINLDEYEDVLQLAKFLIPTKNGHDITWAIDILCKSRMSPELREKSAETANRIFSYKDDSRMRVRIFASVAQLTFEELVILGKDYEKSSLLGQKVREEYNQQYNTSLPLKIKMG